MKSLLFAFRNVLRNRRRSLMTIFIVAVGAAGIQISGGFGLYTYESLREMTARETGHIVIATPAYFEREEQAALEFGISDYPSVQKVATAMPEVRYAIPRIQLSGLVSNGDKTEIFLGTGVDPSTEFLTSGPFLKVLSGRIIAATGNPGADPEVLLGSDLARKLKASVGARLTLLASTTSGSLNGLDVQVVGIISTGKPELDQRKIVLALPTAQELLLTDRVSTISVFLTNTEQTPGVSAAFNAKLPTYAMKTWSDLADYYHKVRGLYNRIFGMLGTIIILMVFFATANTLTMAVMERTREIGTLRALGTTQGKIVNGFVLESLILSFFAVLLGSLVALAVSIGLNFVNIMMPPPPGMTADYPLYVYFSLDLFLITLLGLLIMAALAALTAAMRGVNKTIVEALAYV